jgi:hypothetical protein
LADSALNATGTELTRASSQPFATVLTGVNAQGAATAQAELVSWRRAANGT